MATAKTSRKPRESVVEAKPPRMQKQPGQVQTHADLGAFLAEHRKEAKLSIQKVSEDTRIRLQYIKDIERGDFGKLPANIYTRAYLKSYARCVGADTAKVLEAYDMVGAGVAGEEDMREKERASEKTKAAAHHDAFKPSRVIVVIALAAAALVYAAWRHFRFDGEVPAPTVAAAPEIAPKEPERIAHEIVLLALKDTEIKIIAEGQEVIRKLAAGDVHALPDATQATLEALDPAALEIYLDGQAVPTPARSGENGKIIVLDVNTLAPAPVIH